MTSRYAALGLIALPLLLVVGCGEGLGTSDDDADALAENDAIDESENIATAASALCTYSGAADYSSPLNMKNGGEVWMQSWLESTSPSNDYGSAACEDRYVLECTDLHHPPYDWRLFASAWWGDFPLSQSLCPYASVDMTVYAEVLTVNGLAWVTVGDFSASGTWDGNSCTVWKSVEITLDYVNRVRVAAKASYQVLSTRVPAKVTEQVLKTAIVFE